MRLPRIYQPEHLEIGKEVSLVDDAANHVGRVLRMETGQHLVLFNGDQYDYSGRIISSTKKQVIVQIENRTFIENESPIQLHLAQGISRGDKMDFTIQKSVELGITEITPIFTERCGVKLTGDRLEKKHQQWQKIAISACEQCGRAKPPVIHPAISLSQFIQQQTEQLRLNLHPKATTSIKNLVMPSQGARFIIGPEGGLSDLEIEQAHQAGYLDVLLGPRVLRTETAALTLLTALQVQFGDLA